MLNVSAILIEVFSVINYKPLASCSTFSVCVCVSQCVIRAHICVPLSLSVNVFACLYVCVSLWGSIWAAVQTAKKKSFTTGGGSGQSANHPRRHTHTSLEAVALCCWCLRAGLTTRCPHRHTEENSERAGEGRIKKRGKRREELYRAERGQADKDGDRERHGKTEADNDGGKQKDGENDVSRRFGVRKKRWQQTHGKKGKGRCGWVIHWCACCSGRWSEGSRDRERGGIMRKDRERNGKAVERGRGGWQTSALSIVEKG